MGNKNALYAGSFDPFTIGHLDIVKRALKIFDELTIVVAVSPNKAPLIKMSDRKNLLKKIFADEPRVKIAAWDGLIVDYARDHGITSIVRGLRPTGDFDFEFQMASMNQKLNEKIETVFFITGENLYYISSSLVKDVHKHGGDISRFVPKAISEYLEHKKEGK
ncbi:MAG: pantetheine-phosphate adenylyltransferase [Halobacteriovoraceae bacterium]|nr:pantetheine-phosphate adenylyltransferase [Halobacteriovoraceae bacterium]|tara:strand:+ start:820 stop:1308 length:489 start_codon:yes stop_codon:yes gene_type:complete